MRSGLISVPFDIPFRNGNSYGYALIRQSVLLSSPLAGTSHFLIFTDATSDATNHRFLSYPLRCLSTAVEGEESGRALSRDERNSIAINKREEGSATLRTSLSLSSEPGLESSTFLTKSKNSRQKPRVFTSWRKREDSNLRYGCPHTRVPGVLLQPLGHTSV